MFSRVCFTAAASVIALSAPAPAQPASSIESDALAFGVREGVANMDLSPDGKRAVFVGAGPGRTSIVYIADIAAGTTASILSSRADPEVLRWCGFVSNSRIACRYSAIVKSADGLIPASRMIALDITGKNVKELGQRASSFDWGIRQHDGTIIDWLPGDGNSVLMTRTYLPEGGRTGDSLISRTKSGIGVVRLDISSLKAASAEPPRKNVSDYMSDGQGQVRLIGIHERSGEVMLTGRVKYDYRVAGSREWKELVDYQDDQFHPLAIDATSDSLYALRKREGRFVLTRTKLGVGLAETIVATNPKVDIDNVVRIGNGQRVIGYTYADDRRHTVYFDPEYKALSAALGKALPNLPIVTFVSASADGNKILLFAGGDNDAGRYFLFDKTTKALGEILPAPRPGGQDSRERQVGDLSGGRRNSCPGLSDSPRGQDRKGPSRGRASARWAERAR